MSSIKKNFVYNISITLAQYISGLITFPYVSRILGVDFYGKTDFVSNIVAYSSLFALLGAATVGAREIAICKNDIQKRTQVFSNILAIIACMTLLSLLIMSAATFYVDKLQSYRSLLMIGSLALIFTSFQFEWFFQGIEKFDYIAKRSILIKAVYCISIFVFVRSPDDYILYYALTVASIMVNSIWNIIYARKFVNITFKNLEIEKYLKPICMYGVNKILISMYTTFNVLYLGFMCNDIQIGYYSVANKLFTILLGVIYAFTSVILPRMAALAAENNVNEFRLKTCKSICLIFTVSLPIGIAGVILAPEIVSVLAGSEYYGAIIPMQIILPVIIIVGFAQVCIMQVLIPLKKDKFVLHISIIGACTALLINILFVHKLGAIGTALVLLSSELVSDTIAYVYVIKNKIIYMPWRQLLKRLVSGVPYIGICYMLSEYSNLNAILTLILAITLCGVYFLIENALILKEFGVLSYIKFPTKRMKS